MSLAVASRYANALADVVLDSKNGVEPASALASLRSLEQIIQESKALHHALLSPAVTVAQKHRVMGRLCDGLPVHLLVRNFIFIVVRNRRANLFPLICETLERLLEERQGLSRAQVTSAATLSDASRASLEAQLSRLTGKRIRCNYSVNPDLLGGMVARIGSTVYDGSVRGQLEGLRRKLVVGG
ncbi:MAG: ATP synthase F1 subunit delta [Acidobacteria bacterium]|nr:ATP synthase F1 subunit delta [Acidobacteriota bacterium]